MILIGAKRWRVEVHRCYYDRNYVVSVEPVAYIGRAEFKNFASEFRRLFMNLEGKWRWSRAFTDKASAESFACDLARSLGELAFMVNGELCLAMPRGEP